MEAAPSENLRIFSSINLNQTRDFVLMTKRTRYPFLTCTSVVARAFILEEVPKLTLHPISVSFFFVHASFEHTLSLIISMHNELYCMCLLLKAATFVHFTAE